MKERKDEGWQPFRCARMIRFVAGSAMKFLGTSRLSSIFYNLISRFVLIIKWNDWFYKSILEWSLTRFTLLEFIQIVFFLFFMIRFDEPSFHLSPIFFILIYNRFFILILSVCVCTCIYTTINWTFDIFHVSKKRFTTFHFYAAILIFVKTIFDQIESFIFLRNKFSLLCSFVWSKFFWSNA